MLVDENNFSADASQTLSYRLCYLHPKSIQSSCVVPPAQYAHLAAYRARYHLENQFSAGSSIMPVSIPALKNDEGHLSMDSSPTPVVPAPPLKRTMKKYMYYL